MQEYHSIHQGETIDEAIGRAKPGGELDRRVNEMRMELIAEKENAIQAVRDAAWEAMEYLDGAFTLTDNPEYLAAWTDAEGRLLVGIRKDGTVYFAAGIPPQIAEKLSGLEDALRDIPALRDSISNLQTNFNSHDRALESLTNGLSALADAAFADFHKGEDGLWYAYNRRGNAVGGPYNFGTGNAGGVTTLAELFNAAGDASVVYENPTPITGAALGPNRTLAGLLNAAADNTVVYEQPTPITA